VEVTVVPRCVARGVSFVLLLFAATIAFAQSNADVGVTKTGPDTATAGSTVAYTVTVISNGSDDATNVTLTDNIPEGMTFVSAAQNSGPAFSCSSPSPGTGGSIVCHAATFASGQSATFIFTMQIPANAPGGTTYLNTASVTADVDVFDENNRAVAGTSTPSTAGDVGVTKNGPSTAPPNSDVTYTIAVNSNGPAAAQNVTLTDKLPGTMTFVSLNQSGPTFTCSTPAVGAGGTITCSIASMPVGTSTTLTLVGHIPGGTQSGTAFANSASVTSNDDPNAENDSAYTQLTVSSVDVSIVKSGPPTATAGQTISYAVSVANAGPDVALNTQWFDTLPAGTTFQSLTQNTGPAFACSTPPQASTGSIICTIGPFASGATSTFTLVLNIDPSFTNQSTLTNTANASTDSFDSNPSNNTSSTSAVVTGFTDIAVTKTAAATVVAGANITYTITVTNNGPNAAATTQLSDALPPGTTFVALTQTTGPTFTCTTGATINCSLASLPSGSSATFTLVVKTATSASGTISNTANVSTTTNETTTTNNSSTSNVAVTQSADVSIVKTGPALITPNTNVTYTLAVSNAGPSDAQSITVTDVIPANTTFVSATGSGFACSTPAVGGTGTVTCTMPTLAAAANATLTIVVHSSSSFGGTISNTGTVASTTTDPNPANNTSTTSGSQTVADVAITKTSATAPSGTTGAYTVTVTNNGPSTASTVTMTDTVPANATFASISQTSGPTFTCTTPAAGATGTITCSIGTLTAGQSATFTLVFNGTNQVAQITNTATVTSTTLDPNPANNTATASTFILLFVPALSPMMLGFLALAFTAIGAMILRR
jgi:uncharacterized repeat protein (TIGR01451 family)